MVEERKTCHNWLSGNDQKEIKVPWSDAVPLQYLTSTALFLKIVLFCDIFAQTAQKSPCFNIPDATLKF